jgi:hypothetical protein
MYANWETAQKPESLHQRLGDYERERGDVPMWVEGHFCSIELVTFRELLED